MTFRLHDKPHPPLELKVLDSLYKRGSLSPSDKQNHHNLMKGHMGELRFYNLLKRNLTLNHISLKSLRLESNNSEFQMDSLLINQNSMYLLEVKNFEGDFYIDNNNWYVSPTGKEINNPIIQLKRSESLLRRLTQQLGYNFLIKSYVIFINPEFALFQAPLNLPIIIPAQLNRFINRLNNNPSNLTKYHKQFAERLIERHIEDSPTNRFPNYRYEELKKGIICKLCSGFLSYWQQTKLRCHRCNYEEMIDHAVIRNVEEFKLLFPNEKITTNIIYDWCAVIPSKKTIRRILFKYLTPAGSRRSTYFILKE